MANRWKGNIIAAAAITSSGTDYTGKANGAWGLNSQLQQKQASLWAKGVIPPTAPTIGLATGGNTIASVSFTPSTDNGGGTLTYTATSTPSNFTVTSATSPISFTGLTNNTSYTFTVHANSSYGYTSPESAASNSVSPSASVLLGVGAFGGCYWAGGFGAKLTDPTTAPPTTLYGISLTPAKDAVIVGGSTPGNYLVAYGITNVFGTKYTNPSPAPNDIVQALATNPVTSAIAVAINVSANSTPINAYAWNNGFGTKYASPSLNTYGGLGVTFNPSGTVVALAYEGWNGLAAYAWSSGFGTKYADSSIFSVDVATNVIFSSNGSNILCVHRTSPFITALAWNNGFGSKFTNPVTPLPSAALGIALNSDNSVVAAAHNLTPCIAAYPWSAAGFGSKFANPASVVASGTGRAVVITPSGDIISTTQYETMAYAWNNGFGTKYASSPDFPSRWALAFKP